MPSLIDLFNMPQVMGVYPATKISLNVVGMDGPYTVDIGVDQEHIDAAIVDDEFHTGLATAIKDRAAGEKRIVEQGDRYVKITSVSKDEPDVYWMMSPKTHDWCKREFDCQKVAPFVATLFPLEQKEWHHVLYWVNQTLPTGPDDLYAKIPDPPYRINRFPFLCYWNLCEQEGLILWGGTEREYYELTEDGRKALADQ